MDVFKCAKGTYWRVYLSVKGYLRCENLFGISNHHLAPEIRQTLVRSFCKSDNSTFDSGPRFTTY